MPDEITIDKLSALGFDVFQDEHGTKDVGALLRASGELWLTFYDGVFSLDWGCQREHEFTNDMANVRRAMRLFGLKPPKSESRNGGRPRGKFRAMLEQLDVGGTVLVPAQQYAGKRNTALAVAAETQRKFATKQDTDGYYRITRVE